MLVLSRSREGEIEIDLMSLIDAASDAAERGLAPGQIEMELLELCDGTPTIKIKVTEIRGDKVRLGFDAARCFAIHRSEVVQAILAGQRVSPSPTADELRASAGV